MQDRIALAGVGLESIGNDKITAYDFANFSRNAQSIAPKNISVTAFAGLVNRQLVATFDGFDALLRSRALTREALGPMADVPIRFYIVGYEGQNPRAYNVQLNLDWNRLTHTVPSPNPIYPDGRKNLYMTWTGGNDKGIVELRDHSNAVYADFRALMPLALSAIEQDVDISFDQMIRLAKALLDIEVTRNPDSVGYPLRISAFPLNGQVKTTTYNKR